jgi:hypothetical protein
MKAPMIDGAKVITRSRLQKKDRDIKLIQFIHILHSIVTYNLYS